MAALRHPKTGKMVKNTLINRIKFFFMRLFSPKKTK